LNLIKQNTYVLGEQMTIWNKTKIMKLDFVKNISI
jgi:hypothetical protein